MQMTDGGKASRKLKLVAFGVVMVAVAVLGMKHFWINDSPVSHQPARQALQPEAPPDNVRLRAAASLPETVSDHLLDGDFTTVREMKLITGGCREIFESSFVSVPGTVPSPQPALMADPGQAFEATDAIQGGLPFRRLEFATLGKGRCAIYYQHGGAMYPRFCLAVMSTKDRKMLLVGETHEHVRNLAGLRGLLSRDKSLNVDDPSC